MLELLTEQINDADQSSIIVFSEEPIPASLLSQLPNTLHSFIRRPLHHDLFYLPTVPDEPVASAPSGSEPSGLATPPSGSFAAPPSPEAIQHG